LRRHSHYFLLSRSLSSYPPVGDFARPRLPVSVIRHHAGLAQSPLLHFALGIVPSLVGRNQLHHPSHWVRDSKMAIIGAQTAHGLFPPSSAFWDSIHRSFVLLTSSTLHLDPLSRLDVGCTSQIGRSDNRGNYLPVNVAGSSPTLLECTATQPSDTAAMATVAQSCLGGWDVRKTFVDSVRAQKGNQNVLLLDSGDALPGMSLLSTCS
jgi:hypothetical protein